MKTWIAPKNELKTKNLLMLDLEQVLFVDANLLLNRDSWKKQDKDFYDECCQLRNYSVEFVSEITNLFDLVFLNTYVPEEKANSIMKDFFNVEFPYYYSGSRIKSGGYENVPFDVQIFHLEDGIIGPHLKDDSNNMKRLGVHIFDIEPYNSHSADDNSLKDILFEMKKYL